LGNFAGESVESVSGRLWKRPAAGLLMFKLIYENSLSLLFACLFLGALVGEGISGLHSYNQRLEAHGRGPMDLPHYLGTGDFLDGTFSNWQAAILQLGCLIAVGSVLHQKGAAHSRKLQGDSAAKARREGRNASWLYRHSLSLAFAGLFGASMLAHIVFGSWSYNEANALLGEAPISIGRYTHTADFWFKNLQTWQAEFVALVIYVILSIFLREQGSPESKPVNSPKSETGKTNR
jgi:Domain of unknown function (DUF6766)